MLEAAVGNSAKEFRLQQEIAEAGRVNADVRTLLVDILSRSGGIALLAIGSRGGLVVELVVRIKVKDACYRDTEPDSRTRWSVGAIPGEINSPVSSAKENLNVAKKSGR
jgi:hypothetical protein